MARAQKPALSIATLLFSSFAVFFVIFGVIEASRSSLFMVQVVEISSLPSEAPLDAATLTRLADVPVGRVNLFHLDLRAIEHRILTNSWIREARIEIRLPQTLSIAVGFREPKALLQTPQGVLSYVDSEGTVFGRAGTQQAGLPILTFPDSVPDPAHVRDSLRLLSVWSGKVKRSRVELSSLSWDPERGYRAMVIYPLGPRSVLGPHVEFEGRGRAFVDLGQGFDAASEIRLELKIERLASVLSYLSEKSIPARQIWADAGKKIVVRTARGS